MERYIIISSDDNKLYKDFYEIIAKRWSDLGFKTYYINITDNDEIIKNHYGVIHKIKKYEKYAESFQTQIARLFAANIIHGDILISDIDMLPINGGYFNYFFNELSNQNDKIFLLSGQPYTDVPYYPMCYVLSNSETLKTCLGINNMNFENFCDFVNEKVGVKWNSDEHFLYDCISNNKDKIIINDRIFNNRIDRSNWRYDEKLLNDGFYLDSHLLRPFETYKEEITILLKKINNERN